MTCTRGKMRLLAVASLVFVCLGFWGAAKPAMAAFNPGEMFKKQNFSFTAAMWTVGTIGFSAVAYYLYKNSPAQRTKGYPENLGPGEWYLGAYSGLSYLPPADWKFFRFPPPYQGRIAKNITYQPGILGGIKFGRFFDSLPWLGLELETNFSHNNYYKNQGRISPPIPGGPTYALGGADYFSIWDTQCNILARWGFLKDKEVTFGRLQPYVGIGPGVEIVYGQRDSAKNFAYEGLAGIRYMCTQHLGIFFEYKYSFQYKVELEKVLVQKYGQNGMMQFDVPHHRFVIGISYHFKNLYGN
jgi:opacity protein-like surface antigen